MALAADFEAADTAASLYRWLLRGATGSNCDPFDIHVVASILSLALAESGAGACTVNEATGLAGDDLAGLETDLFPNRPGLFTRLHDLPPPACGDDELCLRHLLRGAAANGSSLPVRLADMVARRCQRPNHLWQDLGLRNRRELGRLMQRHFPILAQRNCNDMKWKKFLYRTICRDEGYTLCAAPICSDCDDFEHCFGEESGESLLARIRRDKDWVGYAIPSRPPVTFLDRVGHDGFGPRE
jgi:nitrogen fixation protein NifQ